MYPILFFVCIYFPQHHLLEKEHLFSLKIIGAMWNSTGHKWDCDLQTLSPTLDL